MSDVITRELVTGLSTAGNKDLYLVIDDQHGNGQEKYRRYLATTATFPTNEPPPEHELRIATARFNAFVDHDRKATAELTHGWIYLFVNGKLWREIEVLDRYQYRDVNLERYRGQPEDARPSLCLPRDTVVIPVSFAGEALTVQAAYSEQQWSWARIEELGGFEASKADRQPSADVNELRDSRCILLDYLQQESIDPDDTYAVSPLEVHNYQLLEMPRQDLLFSLPSWLDMGRTLRDAHDEVIGEICFLQQALANSDYYLPRIPPGEDQQQQAELKVSALHLAMMTAHEVGYGQVRRNLQSSHLIGLAGNSLSDKATQEKLKAGQQRLSLIKCIDIDRLESALHSTEFLALHKKANQRKDLMIAFLQEPRFVAMMRDYATLGSDEQSATRVKGLAAFAEIFDGFNLCAFKMIEPYLGDPQHAKTISRKDDINPIINFIPQLLNLEGKPIALYHALLDFEVLYPTLYADFIQSVQDYQAQDVAELSFAERYSPKNKGIVDELITLIGDEDAQKIIQSLLKLMAGLMTLNESELDQIAQSSSAAAADSYVAQKDNYDSVIQTQKQEIKDLEDEKTALEKEKAKLDAKIENQIENVDEAKEQLDELKQKKIDLETQLQRSKVTDAQYEQLRGLKANIAIQEYELNQLEVRLRDRQYQAQQTGQKIQSVHRTLTIKKRKPYYRTYGSMPEIRTEYQQTDVIEGLGTKSQLKVGAMSHFIGGSRVVRVRLDLDDVIEGRLPQHLIPTSGNKRVNNIQERRYNALNLLREGHGPLTQVETLGVRFPVPSHALNTRNHDVQWALTGLAASMLDQQAQRPAVTVDMYCFKADIDLEVSEAQWNIVQQHRQHQAEFDDYLEASRELKRQKLGYDQERKKLFALRQKLQPLLEKQTKAMEATQRYRDSNARLIRRDRHIHWVQGPLQGVVLVFDINNMIGKWQALCKNSGSLKAWWDAGTSVLDVAGSFVDFGESFLRTLKASSKGNYHNLTKGIREGFRITGKYLGYIGAVLSVISGYLDLQTSFVLSDYARAIGGGLTILSGLVMFGAIVIGSVVLAIAAIVLGVIAAVFSACYQTAEETHWYKSYFGTQHEQHKHTPGLEHWSHPTNCLQGLRSLLCRPSIDIKKDDQSVTITIENSALAVRTTPQIEVDVKGDFNIGNEDEYPWQALYSPFIASTDAKAMADAQKLEPDNKGLMTTYGVGYHSLANGAQITQQGNQTQIRYDRQLFVEMLNTVNKERLWSFKAGDIDDLLFQVRVRGMSTNEQPDLPTAYYDIEHFQYPNKDMKQSKVGQARYYTGVDRVWWYCQEFELDLDVSESDRR